MRSIRLVILFYAFAVNIAYSQDYTLVVMSEKKIDQSILSKLTYQKKHQDTVSIYKELNFISESLKRMGYFFNTLKKTKQIDKTFTAYFNVNKKVSYITLKIDSIHLPLLESKSSKHKTVTLKIEELATTLNNISRKLDQNGRSFSKTQLTNIRLVNDTLYAKLTISTSKRRFIDKVVIKEYPSFPDAFLKYYYKINKNRVFNSGVLNEVSDLSNQLTFAQEIRKPEVLFKQDSTLLYMYLKRKQNNSVDGMLNFVTEDNGDFLLTGNLNLKLINIFNKGEEVQLLWNSAGNQRQEFSLETKLPYVFKTKLSSEVNFFIYRQDSTFSNTRFSTNILYTLSNQFQLGASFSTENSTSTITNDNTISFSNLFSGLDLRYINSRLKINVNPELGRRTTSQTVNQFKIESNINYLWKVSKKSNLFLKNSTGILNSKNYLLNELFRIGGANSIRGFNEQEFFTENYTYVNAEYRITTNSQSYLYTITDYGKLFNKSNTTNLLGLGLGYLFRKKNTQLNINLSVGKRNQEDFDLNSSKLIVSWTNFF